MRPLTVAPRLSVRPSICPIVAVTTQERKVPENSNLVHRFSTASTTGVAILRSRCQRSSQGQVKVTESLTNTKCGVIRERVDKSLQTW